MSTSRTNSIGFIAAVVLLVLLPSCKEQVIYDIGTTEVKSANNKANLKADLQFITIAYRDLYGAEIPPDLLEQLRTNYTSFGDKALVVDEIVESMLLNPDLTLPSENLFRVNIPQFMNDVYEQFLLREATDFEIAYWKSMIEADASITVRDVYYVVMTSTEYKYY